MSTLYDYEPPTSGKVVLNTSFGDLQIDLWSKEAPKACRNFVQLCMENYFDNVIFHRVIKDFMAQTGDPTGSGSGGQSIYNGPFKDEFHQRLKFTRRGLVAMANSNQPNTNMSQFFITFGPTPQLTNKHTIFGSIGANTMYNILKINEIETDVHDRPKEPPIILRTNVIENPFDDIQPRKSDQSKNNNENSEKNIKQERLTAFKHLNANKNLNLLSFADEEEEDISPKIKNKPKSIHDVVKDDPMLSSQATQIEPVLSNTEQTSSTNKNDNNTAKQLTANELKEKAAKEKLQQILEEQRKIQQEMKDNMKSTIIKKKQIEKSKYERAQIEKEFHQSANDFNPMVNSTYDTSSNKLFQVETIEDHLKQNLRYMVKSKKSKANSKNDERESNVLSLLKDFTAKLKDNTTMGDREQYDQLDIPNNVNDNSWMWHKLNFEKDPTVSTAIDANTLSIESHDITDPRNLIHKRKRTNKNDI